VNRALRCGMRRATHYHHLLSSLAARRDITDYLSFG